MSRNNSPETQRVKQEVSVLWDCGRISEVVIKEIIIDLSDDSVVSSRTIGSYTLYQIRSFGFDDLLKMGIWIDNAMVIERALHRCGEGLFDHDWGPSSPSPLRW